MDPGDETSSVNLLATVDKYDALFPVVAVFVWEFGDHFVMEYDFVTSTFSERTNVDVAPLEILDK